MCANYWSEKKRREQICADKFQSPIISFVDIFVVNVILEFMLQHCKRNCVYRLKHSLVSICIYKRRCVWFLFIAGYLHFWLIKQFFFLSLSPFVWHKVSHSSGVTWQKKETPSDTISKTKVYSTHNFKSILPLSTHWAVKRMGVREKERDGVFGDYYYSVKSIYSAK